MRACVSAYQLGRARKERYYLWNGRRWIWIKYTLATEYVAVSLWIDSEVDFNFFSKFIFRYESVLNDTYDENNETI